MTDLAPHELAAYQARLTAPAPAEPTPSDLHPDDLATYQARLLASPTVYTTLAAAPVTLTGGTLTAAETAYLKAQLGPDLDLTDAQTRYTRLGTAPLVAAEIIRERLSALTAGPAQYAISGVYSQDTSANITALREQLTQIVTGGSSPGGIPEVTRVTARPRRQR